MGNGLKNGSIIFSFEIKNLKNFRAIYIWEFQTQKSNANYILPTNHSFSRVWIPNYKILFPRCQESEIYRFDSGNFFRIIFFDNIQTIFRYHPLKINLLRFSPAMLLQQYRRAQKMCFFPSKFLKISWSTLYIIILYTKKPPLTCVPEKKNYKSMCYKFRYNISKNHPH